MCTCGTEWNILWHGLRKSGTRQPITNALMCTCGTGWNIHLTWFQGQLCICSTGWRIRLKWVTLVRQHTTIWKWDFVHLWHRIKDPCNIICPGQQLVYWKDMSQYALVALDKTSIWQGLPKLSIWQSRYMENELIYTCGTGWNIRIGDPFNRHRTTYRIWANVHLWHRHDHVTIKKCSEPPMPDHISILL